MPTINTFALGYLRKCNANKTPKTIGKLYSHSLHTCKTSSEHQPHLIRANSGSQASKGDTRTAAVDTGYTIIAAVRILNR